MKYVMTVLAIVVTGSVGCSPATLDEGGVHRVEIEDASARRDGTANIEWGVRSRDEGVDPGGRDLGAEFDEGVALDGDVTADDAGSDHDGGFDHDAALEADAALDPDAGQMVFSPPFGGSSGGGGGAVLAGELLAAPSGVQYRLVVPASYRDGTATALLLAYSGTEGGAMMTQNLQGAGPAMGLGDVVFAVLDGVQYRGDGRAGAQVLDDVRADYNIDNDRTYLLSESAGTTAGFALGFDERPGYFAAFWANDVNASAAPEMSAAALGFAPWGNVGPGGQLATAQQIVDGMRGAGYRLSEPAPYDGVGADRHGSSDQFMAALRWFVGKSRR